MAVKQRSKSLSARGEALSNTFYQLKVLSGEEEGSGVELDSFETKLIESGYSAIRPTEVEILQINIGKLCNQSCAHCHVDAGPDKTRENMDRQTLEKCLRIIRDHTISTVDITGGAPELNPHFRWFVEECSKIGAQVMDRCNLTIIRANKRFHDLPEFFAKHNVHVVSSLPYFTKNRTDNQRGDGVFDDSIEALQMLNAAGYGKEDTGLLLDLVYNPAGAFLPGSQQSLEKEFKRQLQRRYGIIFNSLYAITNLPISRFLEYLIVTGNYQTYMEELVNAFNPTTIDGLMCRNTLSISWDGYIHDCDFNQMLDLKVDSPSNHIDNFDIDALMERKIVTNRHCFGCTAGAGSSCGGSIDS